MGASRPRVFLLIESAAPAYDRFVYVVYSLAHAATGLPVRRESAAAFRPLLGGPAWAAAVASLTGRGSAPGRAGRICRYVVGAAGTGAAGPAAFVLMLKVLRPRDEPAGPARVAVTGA